MTKTELIYVTSSSYKRDELEILADHMPLSGGERVRDVFDVVFETLAVQEELHQSIDDLVKAEAKAAYRALRLPCFVEHAGLILKGRLSPQYPGALTKPMWNSLGDDFVAETGSAGSPAIARAVVGYCDGASVRLFVGQTPGVIAPEPRGSRAFYWDTVFIPTDNNPAGLTYAEIVESGPDGLEEKVTKHSQSARALIQFMDWRRSNRPVLWENS